MEAFTPHIKYRFSISFYFGKNYFTNLLNDPLIFLYLHAFMQRNWKGLYTYLLY